MHFIAFLILSIFPTGASHARPEPESADITQRDDRCLITLSDGFSAERWPGPSPSGGHASRSCRVSGRQVMQYGLASVAPSGNSAIFAAPTGTASAWEISRRVGCADASGVGGLRSTRSGGPGRLGIVSGRAGVVHVASGGRGGGQALMDFLEFVMNGGLVLQVLTVQSLDELMSWLLALEVRCGGSRGGTGRRRPGGCRSASSPVRDSCTS